MSSVSHRRERTDGGGRDRPRVPPAAVSG